MDTDKETCVSLIKECTAELVVYFLIGVSVSRRVCGSRSKRIHATPLLIIRMFYIDMFICILCGLLAVISNLSRPSAAIHCPWGPAYFSTLLSSFLAVLSTRVWTSSSTERSTSGQRNNTMLMVGAYILIDSCTMVVQYFFYISDLNDIIYLSIFHIVHLIIYLFIIYHHSSILKYLEEVTSVKEHLLSKLHFRDSPDVLEDSWPQPTFRPLPLRLRSQTSSPSPVPTDENVVTNTVSDERLDHNLKSKEGLYDNIILYMTLVCVLLFVPLVLGDRSIFSVYFIAIFYSAWATLLMFCVQERSMSCFYICVGQGTGQIGYRKASLRTVTFSKFIQYLEFDDNDFSPDPSRSKIEFLRETSGDNNGFYQIK